MKRRNFLTSAGAAGAAAVAASALPAPAVAQGTMQWKMVTPWPKNLPGPGVAAQMLADRITALSGGRIEVKLFAAGELVPGQGVFDAVSEGTADLYHSVPSYWGSKSKGILLFGSQPFGLLAEEQVGWILHGGGQALYDEMYARFNLKPFLCGNSGPQWAGWFRKEINSVDDLKGLKMRIPGIGGEVMQRAGASQITVPASEIFTALQTGAIDAAEWVGPYNDIALGLNRVAKYYYYPGWHEMGPMLQCTVNLDAWNSLPPDLQAIVENVCQAINDDMMAEYTWGNAVALEQIKADPNVQLRPLPDDVLKLLKSLSEEIIGEMAATDEWAARIKTSFDAFQRIAIPHHEITELAYMNARKL